jgi:hypothetical protein
MGGDQANRMRRTGHLARLAVVFLSLGATTRAQVPGPLSPIPTGGTRAPNPVPPARMPDTGFTDVADSVDSSQAILEQKSNPQPWYTQGPGLPLTSPRVEMGIFETIQDSVFGEPDPRSWRPLRFTSFFSEGWNEPWVPSPKGSGGAPRQGWINAVAGNLYRNCFFTFSYGANDPPKGNAYLGSYTLMTPLSRRLMLITNIPFVLRNSVESGQPIIAPSGPTVPTSRSHAGFGDISFTTRVLLHETKDFSLTAELAVLTPTGHLPLARKTSLTPALGFWTNLADGWVIRGGIGDLISTQSGGNTLISQLAVGRTLTDHDVPLLGDFTYYLSAVVNTPLPKGAQTSVTLTPGIRTHLGHDWYFLAGLPTPLTETRVANLGMILWFVKSW